MIRETLESSSRSRSRSRSREAIVAEREYGLLLANGPTLSLKPFCINYYSRLNTILSHTSLNYNRISLGEYMKIMFD